MNKRQLSLVIWEKSRLSLKSEATINYLSYAWWIIEPVLHMFVYYLVFEVMLQRGGPGYIYNLLVGLVPWLWFSRVLNQGAGSLVAARGLMNQIVIPKLFFPLVPITQGAVKQVLVFIILLVFLTLSGNTPSIHWLSSIALILVQLAIMIPTACLLAVLVAYIRDFSFIIPTVLQFLFFFSGIFFSFENISERSRNILLLNPMAGLIEEYREVLLNNTWPDWSYLLYVLIAAFILWIITLYIYNKIEYAITRVTQE